MLSFLTVNIGAASRDWAESLLTWLAKQSGDVFLLTETSAGPGTDYLLTRFRDAGYAVVHTPDSNGDRGTDPVAGLVRQISHGGPGPGVDEFLLVGREERFGYGVIVADPGASEGPSDLVLLAVGIEGCGGVLGAVVGMEDDARRRAAVRDGHIEGGGDQFGAQGGLSAIRLWSLPDGRPLWGPLHGHIGAVNALACTEIDGLTVLVSGGIDRTVRVWDLAVGTQSGLPLYGHTESILAVACTHLNGRPLAASSGGDGLIRIWDLTTHEEATAPLTAHRGAVNALACCMLDGRPTLVSGGADRTVRFWDMEYSEEIHQIAMPSAVTALSAAPTHHMLVGSGRDVICLRTPNKVATG